ncbi:hypothetical protein RclHR1_09700005 [Rhizophagus clarus]|uniref:Uncharacterized protein n=1 Tax=Rhizophagus clarus TaxID=94130 RepID=A0A2Z6S5J0_9GLOM|nr:hypothetical protein RclHR1_09700005 [Rhizophagus clarus]GET03645.1 hypothetical protein GLOIN_2v1781313 [Rhizophagus clarus]
MNSDNNYNATNLNSSYLNTSNNVNIATYMSQNTTFEFYFHLPNDTQIYHVTYSELHPSENIRCLNNGINLSHIPDNQFPHHYNVQSLIRQQIQQRVQQPVQQQFYDIAMTQPTSQTYSETTSVGNISDNDMQDIPIKNKCPDNVQKMSRKKF